MLHCAALGTLAQPRDVGPTIYCTFICVALAHVHYSFWACALPFSLAIEKTEPEAR